MYITNSTKNESNVRKNEKKYFLYHVLLKNDFLDAVYSLSLHISYLIKHFIVIDKQRARLASDAFTVKDIEKS